MKTKRLWLYLPAGAAALAFLFLLIPNLDLAARTLRSIRSGAFSVQQMRNEIAAFNGGREIPVEPIAVKISEKDGMRQVLVPAGEFVMGRGKGIGKESPRHRVYVDAFWMDQTTVTNAMYEKCVQAGVCAPPTPRLNPYYGRWIYRDHPVVYVNWHHAAQYCEWAGRRLPTEAEWEKAARGTDERKYPWGNTPPNPSLANYADSLIGEPVSAFRYPMGASPYGALNMAGNVRQWVADWFWTYYYIQSPYDNPQGPPNGVERSMRGGAYDADDSEILTTYRYRHYPPSAGASRGFRCAESAKE